MNEFIPNIQPLSVGESSVGQNVEHDREPLMSDSNNQSKVRQPLISSYFKKRRTGKRNTSQYSNVPMVSKVNKYKQDDTDDVLPQEIIEKVTKWIGRHLGPEVSLNNIKGLFQSLLQTNKPNFKGHVLSDSIGIINPEGKFEPFTKTQ